MPKYSRLEINRRLQGKQLPIRVRAKLDKFFGRASTEMEAKKRLVRLLSGKSNLAREKIYKKLGIDYEQRKKFEGTVFGGHQSLQELKIQEREQKKKKEAMVKLGRASARLVNNNSNPLSCLRGSKNKLEATRDRLRNLGKDDKIQPPKNNNQTGGFRKLIGF